MKVVALGTGSKCIGQGKMSKEGKWTSPSVCTVTTSWCSYRMLA